MKETLAFVRNSAKFSLRIGWLLVQFVLWLVANTIAFVAILVLRLMEIARLVQFDGDGSYQRPPFFSNGLRSKMTGRLQKQDLYWNCSPLFKFEGTISFGPEASQNDLDHEEDSQEADNANQEGRNNEEPTLENQHNS